MDTVVCMVSREQGVITTIWILNIVMTGIELRDLNLDHGYVFKFMIFANKCLCGAYLWC